MAPARRGLDKRRHRRLSARRGQRFADRVVLYQTDFRLGALKTFRALENLSDRVRTARIITPVRTRELSKTSETLRGVGHGRDGDA